MSKAAEYVLERTFDAPRNLVWRAWTDPDLLGRWYGPNVETIIHEFDLRPGGVWRNEMKWGDTSNYQKMTFQEIVEPERLVWHHASADAQWNVVPNPMMPDWPTVLLTTVTFIEESGKTRVRLSQLPMNASEAQETSFAATMSGMDGGWGQGFEILDSLLLEVAA